MSVAGLGCCWSLVAHPLLADGPPRWLLLSGASVVGSSGGLLVLLWRGGTLVVPGGFSAPGREWGGDESLGFACRAMTVTPSGVVCLLKSVISNELSR